MMVATGDREEGCGNNTRAGEYMRMVEVGRKNTTSPLLNDDLMV